jgi:hypothetical protein
MPARRGRGRLQHHPTPTALRAPDGRPHRRLALARGPRPRPTARPSSQDVCSSTGAFGVSVNSRARPARFPRWLPRSNLRRFPARQWFSSGLPAPSRLGRFQRDPAWVPGRRGVGDRTIIRRAIPCGRASVDKLRRGLSQGDVSPVRTMLRWPCGQPRRPNGPLPFTIPETSVLSNLKSQPWSQFLSAIQNAVCFKSNSNNAPRCGH